MVDVDHRQGQRLGLFRGFGAGAAELVVKGLAVGQVGQGVGGGVAAHLFQMLAQASDLGGGLVQALGQGLVLALHPFGGPGQGFDEPLQSLGRGVFFQGPAGAGQGMAVLLAGPLSLLDRLGDRGQFLVQLIAGVADLVVEAGLGQEGRGELLADPLGDRLAHGQQTLDFLSQRAVGIRDEMQPKLVVKRGRPNLPPLHVREHLAGKLIGGGTAQGAFNASRHSVFPSHSVGPHSAIHLLPQATR